MQKLSTVRIVSKGVLGREEMASIARTAVAAAAAAVAHAYSARMPRTQIERANGRRLDAAGVGWDVHTARYRASVSRPLGYVPR